MSIQTTCCVTGHRDIPEEKLSFVKSELRNEILSAIQDGFTHFISGFAAGVDLLFAEQIALLQDEGQQITLEAAIPYRGRLKTKDIQFKRLMERCVAISVTAEEYSKSCYINRNRNMVQLSARVIAVYDGRDSGGTAFTIRYARVTEREVKIINI